MYYPRPRDETYNQSQSQIFDALAAGRPLLGGVLDWAGQVVPALSRVSDGNAMAVNNAVFDVVDLALTMGKPVTFRRCQFLDRVFSTLGSRLGRITFVDCNFMRPYVLKNVAVEALKFDRCEFTDRCLMDLAWQIEAVELRRCVFTGSFQLTLNENGDMSPESLHLNIDECEFRDRATFEIHTPVVEISMENCQFSALSLTELLVPATLQTLSFQGSRMLGQLKVRGPTLEELLGFITSKEPFLPPKLNFKSTLITGSLNLRDCQFASVDFEDASIVDGGLELGEVQLRLAEEEMSHPKREGRFDRLSRQYELLSRALPRLPQTSAGEDTCIFRMRTYQLAAEVERIGQGPYYLVIALVWALLVLLFVLIVWVRSPWPALCVAGSLLGIAGLAWNPFGWVPQRISQACFAAWDRMVLGGMLGYGVRVKNALGSAAACILVFAAVYWSASKYSDEIGRIEFDGSNYLQRMEVQGSTVSDGTRDILLEVRDSLYYSVVTFTTVGYGDFTPQGRLRSVAAFEALLGTIMIALVMVIFARKYLRL